MPENLNVYIGRDEDSPSNLLGPLVKLLEQESSVLQHAYERPTGKRFEQVRQRLATLRQTVFPDGEYSNARFIFLNATQCAEEYLSHRVIGYNRELIFFIKEEKYALAYLHLEDDEMNYCEIDGESTEALKIIINELSQQKEVINGYEQCFIEDEKHIQSLNQNILPLPIKLYKRALYIYLLGQLPTKMGPFTHEILTNLMLNILGEESFLKIHFPSKVGIATIVLTKEGKQKLEDNIFIFDVANVLVTPRNPGSLLFSQYITEHATHLRPRYKGEFTPNSIATVPKKNELEIWHLKDNQYLANYFETNEDTVPLLKVIELTDAKFFSRSNEFLKRHLTLFARLTEELQLARSCQTYFLDPRIPNQFMTVEQSETKQSFDAAQINRVPHYRKIECGKLDQLISSTNQGIVQLQQEIALVVALCNQCPNIVYTNRLNKLNSDLAASTSFLEMLEQRRIQLHTQITAALQSVTVTLPRATTLPAIIPQHNTTVLHTADIDEVDWTFPQSTVTGFGSLSEIAFFSAPKTHPKNIHREPESELNPSAVPWAPGS